MRRKISVSKQFFAHVKKWPRSNVKCHHISRALIVPETRFKLNLPLGIVLFVCGFLINIDSDQRLRNLRDINPNAQSLYSSGKTGFLVVFWQWMVFSWSFRGFQKKPEKEKQKTMKRLWKNYEKTIKCQKTTKKLPKHQFLPKEYKLPYKAQSYQVPRGGFFEVVSAANYFGEILEWIGFALAGLNVASVWFAGFSLVFLGLRGLHHHRWIWQFHTFQRLLGANNLGTRLDRKFLWKYINFVEPHLLNEAIDPYKHY